MDKRFVQAHKEARWALWLTLLYLAAWLAAAYLPGVAIGFTGLPHWFEMACLLVPLLFILLCWAMVARRREASRYLRQHWKKGILGGIGTMGSYGLALWAMTQAPLAVVAALRETSILFGALIAFIVLKEQLMPLRIVAACGIAAGAILLRLA